MNVNAVGSNEAANVSSTMGIPPAEGAVTSSRGATVAGGAPIDSSRTADQDKDAAGEPTPEQLKQMIVNMQSDLDSMNINLEYFLYGAHDRKVAVKVVNRETGDVIREIPPKEIQALQEKMSELIGMIFNKEA